MINPEIYFLLGGICLAIAFICCNGCFYWWYIKLYGGNLHGYGLGKILKKQQTDEFIRWFLCLSKSIAENFKWTNYKKKFAIKGRLSFLL
jgi:hypothetical protein